MNGPKKMVLSSLSLRNFMIIADQARAASSWESRADRTGGICSSICTRFAGRFEVTDWSEKERRGVHVSLLACSIRKPFKEKWRKDCRPFPSSNPTMPLENAHLPCRFDRVHFHAQIMTAPSDLLQGARNSMYRMCVFTISPGRYCNLDCGKNLKGIVWKQSCHTSWLEGLLILLARIWVAFMASIIRSETCFFRGRAGSCTSGPLESCREFIWVQVRSMSSSMDERNYHVVDQFIISFHS